MQTLELSHQRVVNMQTTRGIHNHHGGVTVHHGAAGDRDVLAGHSGGGRLGAGLDRDAVIAHVDVAAADVHVAAGLGVEDRKSTRLNSSHVAISYAVFCLKKKNNQRATEAS